MNNTRVMVTVIDSFGFTREMSEFNNHDAVELREMKSFIGDLAHVYTSAEGFFIFIENLNNGVKKKLSTFALLHSVDSDEFIARTVESLV